MTMEEAQQEWNRISANSFHQTDERDTWSRQKSGEINEKFLTGHCTMTVHLNKFSNLTRWLVYTL